MWKLFKTAIRLLAVLSIFGFILEVVLFALIPSFRQHVIEYLHTGIFLLNISNIILGLIASYGIWKWKKWAPYLVAISFIVGGVAIFAQFFYVTSHTPLTAVDTSEWKTFTNKESMYTIKYPPVFEVDDIGSAQCLASYSIIRKAYDMEIKIWDWSPVAVDEVLKMYQMGDHGCGVKQDELAKNATPAKLGLFEGKRFGDRMILNVEGRTLDISITYKNETDKKSLEAIMSTLTGN